MGIKLVMLRNRLIFSLHSKKDIHVGIDMVEHNALFSSFLEFIKDMVGRSKRNVWDIYIKELLTLDRCKVCKTLYNK